MKPIVLTLNDKILCLMGLLFPLEDYSVSASDLYTQYAQYSKFALSACNSGQAKLQAKVKAVL